MLNLPDDNPFSQSFNIKHTINPMRLILSLVLILLSRASLAEDTAQNSTDWSEESRNYISNSADVLVQWIDDFFGDSQQSSESEATFMRLRTSGFVRHDAASTLRISLRGKVYLKNLDDRLSLLFSDEDEISNQNSSDVSELRNESTDVALQYTEIDSLRHRLDFRFGIRSSLQPKAAIRYRYERPKGEHRLFRSVQRFRYRGEDGFDVISEFEQSYTLSATRLLSTSAQFHYGEVTDGVEWRSGIRLSHKLDDHKALSYFATIAGQTRPDYLTETYGFGTNYRRSFYKDWLFLEFEPGYFWNRSLVTDERKGGLQLTSRIEILFD